MTNTFTITQTLIKKDFFYPDSDGCNIDFASTELSNYIAINDNKDIIDDLTYNYCNSDAESDLYLILSSPPIDWTIPTGEINLIRIHERIRMNDIEKPWDVYIVTSSSYCSDYYYSNKLNTITSFNRFSHVLTTNPMTSNIWDWSEILDLNIGLKCENTSVATDGILSKIAVSMDVDGAYRGVWCDGTYIYIACYGDGIAAYTFNGSALLLKDIYDDDDVNDGLVHQIWGDGTYIYAAAEYGGIIAYSFDGTSFTYIDNEYTGGAYYDVFGNGTYIYAACGTSGLRAYSFNGTTFTLITTLDNGGTYYGVWCDGTYIYAACGADGIRAYSFDGAALTLITTLDNGGTYLSVWGDGTYIYAACFGDGIRAYTFDGAAFTLKDTQDDGGNYWDVWGDSTYIYAARDTEGITTYSFNGTSFTFHGTSGTSGLGVYGDGTYIYGACNKDGIKAFEESRVYVSSVYLEVVYDAIETVILPIPDEISSNHSRNVNMLNFWNGEREVYSISRSNKTLVLRGMDWSDTSCTDMLAVRTMGKNGDDVTLSGLNMYIFNDDYKICSFGWKEINQNPPHYEWILQLEYAD
jgi:hypothetical protein